MLTAKHFCLVLAMFVSVASVSADYLTPAGPPGSSATVMPTLTQIEPRQIIDSLPYEITNSGPYVLTKNLTGSPGNYGIVVRTNSITINLNGFTLKGVPGSLSGISVPDPCSFVVIKNGVISEWGQNGISGLPANNSKIEDLLVSNNGYDGASLGTNCSVLRCSATANAYRGFIVGADCTIMESTARGNLDTGFQTLSGCVIQKCLADKNGNYGFDVDRVGQISACTAAGNGNNGFNLQHSCSVLDSCAYMNWCGFRGWDGIVFSRCVAYSNEYGFYAAENCSFSDSSAYANEWQGFYGDSGCSVKNCTAYGNFDGVGASRGSVISGSSACYNRGHGFWLGAETRMEGCSGSGNPTGIAAQVGCYVSGNLVSFSSVSGITASDKARIENNHVFFCVTGIELTGSGNVLSRNTMLNNPVDYQISGDNQLDLLVSELPSTIAWPSKATLSGNLKGSSSSDGISITASDVVLDLAGFTLSGVPGSLNGVTIAPNCSNVEIKNGAVSGWGTYGIDAPYATLLKITGVLVSSNSVDGIRMGTNSTVTECHLVANAGNGLKAYDNCTVRRCDSRGNSVDGMNLAGGASVSESICRDNGDDGIQLTGRKCTLDGNTLIGNRWGIYDGIGGNLIIRNRASSNTVVNFDITPNSSYGTIVNGPGEITTSNPWANFGF